VLRTVLDDRWNRRKRPDLLTAWPQTSGGERHGELQGARLTGLADSNAPPGIPGMARMGAELLNELPADDRQRRCAEVLAWLKSPT
jgi:hypothetical protein